jgi:hypothetical protein
MKLPTVEDMRSKVERAKQNIEEFNLRALDFYETDPCEIRFKDDPERGQRTWYVARIEPVPDNLAAIAADAIQNLRKPLDYLATRIEYGACGTKPKHKVYFPVGGSASQYEAVRRAYIKCAGQEAIDAFDATEPYKGGKGHALWVLHELNRPDKHEFPIATAASRRAVNIGALFEDAVRRMPPTGDASEMFAVQFPFTRLCPLKVGDPFFVEAIYPEMSNNRQFLLDIAFYEPGVIECESALPVLVNLANLVQRTIKAFAPLLS